MAHPYYHKSNLATWKIEQGFGAGWVLQRLTTVSWQPIDAYLTPEEAAAAVANGTTGEHDWDNLHHNPEFFDLSRWVEDKTGK